MPSDCTSIFNNQRLDFACVWHGLVPSRQMGSEKKMAAFCRGPAWRSTVRHKVRKESLSSANSALEGGAGVLHQDASDLFDHGGMIQTNVEAVHEQFRGDAVHMRARIGNDPVSAVGLGWVTNVRDDRIGSGPKY